MLIGGMFLNVEIGARIMNSFEMVNECLVKGHGVLSVEGITVYINEPSIVGAKPRYYIIDAVGNHLFIKTKDRMLAQQVVDVLLGKARYRVRDNRL